MKENLEKQKTELEKQIKEAEDHQQRLWVDLRFMKKQLKLLNEQLATYTK